MKLKVRSMAYASAVFFGLYLFVAGLLTWSGITLPFLNHGIIEMMSGVFDGYGATPGGAVVGLVYGLVWGGVWGGLIAWLYNTLQ